ncbi:acyl-CoA synthetase [Neobacillus sp. NPDC097160]|uniref:acyl-CoA synthetase n=1 Tax=Neobacillus sp. NPDC097160 TaxID=3364298 RepID=UPI003820363A
MVEESDLIAPEYYNMVGDIDRHGDGETKVAIYWEDNANHSRVVTYQELRELSNKFGNALKSMGLKKGDTVIIILPRIPETYITYVAALKLGLVVSPGTEMLRQKDLLYRIKHSQAKAIICHHSLAEKMNEIRPEVKSLKYFIVIGEEVAGWENYEILIQKMSSELKIVQTRSDDMAFLNYTSGTTGNPKGVIHQHSWAYAHQAVSTKFWLNLRSDDVVWCTGSPGWAMWQQNAFTCTLGVGASSVSYLGRLNAEKYLELLDKYKVNVLCTTPTEYRLMAKSSGLDQYRLPSLRNTLSCGEPLDHQVTETFKKYFNVQVRDGYGQTENTLLVATLDGMKAKTGSMGKPTLGNKVSIIDESGNPVQVGQVGMIAVYRSVPSLFKGYLNDPERTSAAFRGDWYITGDLARMDEDGYFWFEGRSDDIIVSSGYTIGPSEVEEALNRHNLVKECAVVASPDQVRGFIVKAFVVLEEDIIATDDLVKELQEHVKTFTAPYKYPREIEFVSSLPKTVSGKVRRGELREIEKKRKLFETQNLS